MERLWAPWRLQYVAKERTEGCIFCQKPLAGDDRSAHIVHRGVLAYVMLNTFPYNNGHIMVAPFAHIADLEALPAETLHEVMDLAQLATRALKSSFSPDGLNLGFNLGAAAGAGDQGPPAPAPRAPLAGRHQLHAGHRRRTGHPGIARPDLRQADRGVRTLEGVAGFLKPRPRAVRRPGIPRVRSLCRP